MKLKENYNIRIKTLFNAYDYKITIKTYIVLRCEPIKLKFKLI